MPPLSEAWATAYVQILTMLIIFALGIPALAIQLVVQDDIRNVFQRRWRGTVWYILVVSILVAIVAFIWVLHPPFKKAQGNKNSTVSLPVTVSSTAAANQDPQTGRFVITVGGPQVNGVSNDEESSLIPVFAGFVMTVIPMSLLIIGFTYSNYLRRQHIIRELENELIEHFCEGESTKKRLRKWLARLRDFAFRRKHKKRRPRERRPASPPHPQRHLDEETLSDLIYLGRNGKTGRDKKLVLDALDRIACQAQEAPTYQGDELEDLIRGLKEIVLSGEQPGNDDNFNHVVEILKNIRYRLSQQPGKPKYIDAGLADKVLEELGVEAVKTKSEQTTERFLEEASSSSKIVFRIGLIALYNKQFHTAILALNKLETLAEDTRLAACPNTFDLLGLIAHFMMSGTATRMRASSFLSQSVPDFSPSIDDCLAGAYAHHYQSGNFDTADMIFQLRQEIIS